MSLKIFFYHLLVSIFVIALYTFMKVNLLDNNVIHFILFITITLLYFFSGYLLTCKKVIWYNYFPVAIIGLLFWTYCSLNFSEANKYAYTGIPTIWSYYELYIAIKKPLNLIYFGSLSVHDHLIIDKILKFIMPIFISLLQFWGGKVKLKI